MGIRGCDVTGCESIFNDHRIIGHGDICEQHKEELSFIIKIAVRKLTKKITADFFEGE